MEGFKRKKGDKGRKEIEACHKIRLPCRVGGIKGQQGRFSACGVTKSEDKGLGDAREERRANLVYLVEVTQMGGSAA